MLVLLHNTMWKIIEIPRFNCIKVNGTAEGMDSSLKQATHKASDKLKKRFTGLATKVHTVLQAFLLEAALLLR
jgi:hypothetical protein